MSPWSIRTNRLYKFLFNDPRGKAFTAPCWPTLGSGFDPWQDVSDIWIMNLHDCLSVVLLWVSMALTTQDKILKEILVWGCVCRKPYSIPPKFSRPFEQELRAWPWPCFKWWDDYRFMRDSLSSVMRGHVTGFRASNGPDFHTFSYFIIIHTASCFRQYSQSFTASTFPS